jgi:hypothetical protein
METAQKEPPIINAYNNDHKGRGWLFCCCCRCLSRTVTTPALILSVGCKLTPTDRSLRTHLLSTPVATRDSSKLSENYSQRIQRVPYCSASHCAVYLIAALLFKGHFQKAICCALECQMLILAHVKRTATQVSDSTRKAFVNKFYTFRSANYDSVTTV